MRDLLARGVYLLLGGVILLPYALVVVLFTQMFKAPTVSPAEVIPALLVCAVIAVIPAFLRGTRAIQIVAARSLLGVDLPDQVGDRVDRESRLRSGLWFFVHLLIGGLVAAGLLIALPTALSAIMQWFGIGAPAFSAVPFHPGWLSLIGFLLIVVVLYGINALGALAKVMAPVLLGPSQAERIAALEARTGQLVERNRLARELHDSIGHALTVAILQATAARHKIDDRGFVTVALTAIEDAGRTAVADLDHVLGLLREENAGRNPQPTLTDLPELLAGYPAVAASVSGELSRVRPAIGREAYRIIQESLTNAAKHAPGAPAALDVEVSQRELRIRVTNRYDHKALPGTGRGLTGMRERVSLLGGQMSAGLDGGMWTVTASLPVLG
ncbi:MAG TPA: histidine kinase [Candidatus Limnocylindrales bacterium]